MNGVICFSVTKNCQNLIDSYGEICVGCNCCGRIDPNTMYQCRIETDKAHLAETAQHLIGEDYQTDLQQNNILAAIEHYVRHIRESKAAINQKGDAQDG